MADTHDDWHEHFFEGLWLDVQEHSFGAAETRELVDAGREVLQLAPDTRVLDIPCGNGRTAVELAARGHRVTGIDRSAPLLERARSAAADRGVDVEWIESDMWQLSLDASFDAAVCLWSSLGYGSEEDDEHFLASVTRALRPGGGLLLETHVVETLLPWFEPHGFRWAGDVAVAENRSYDPARGRLETEWVLSGPDRREHRRSSLRLYTYRELVERLGRHGLGEFEAFGSPDLEPFELGSSRLLLAARRV